MVLRGLLRRGECARFNGVLVVGWGSEHVLQGWRVSESLFGSSQGLVVRWDEGSYCGDTCVIVTTGVHVMDGYYECGLICILATARSFTGYYPRASLPHPQTRLPPRRPPPSSPQNQSR